MNFIKNLFSNKSTAQVTEIDDELNDILEEMQDDVDIVDYSVYPDPDIKNIGSDKTILWLDDMTNMKVLYGLDINKVKNIYKEDINKDFNIINCFGKYAGFIAEKYIHSDDRLKIDYALVDITLGYGIKLTNGDYVEYDGVDIMLDLLKLNPDMKFMFCSAHTLNRKNPTVNGFFTKFEDATGLDISNYYINKNSDRYVDIHKLLYEDR